MTMLGPIPEPEIIVKKRKVKAHAHHGGAWKVAYADFVTAMMAFFLLMWLLGSTSDNQRRGIADYFAPPSLIKTNSSGGSDGVLGGRSVREKEGAAAHAEQSLLQLKAVAPVDAGTHRPSTDLGKLQEAIRDRLEKSPDLKGMEKRLHFRDTPEGLRIELIDDADYSMFVNGSDAMDPRAQKLVAQVADVIKGVPNRLAIRGHTDAVPFSGRPHGLANNWSLSAARAEATRRALEQSGIGNVRFSRLEGVADTEPFIASNPMDPRNRRMSITLLREG